MNKTHLKNFAISARVELLSRVRDRAALYGLTEEKCRSQTVASSETFEKPGGGLLSRHEAAQRDALLSQIRRKGFAQVMEEAAYTWFNRFIALKYMEEHRLLPVEQRVLPERAGEVPQIVREAQRVELSGLRADEVIQMLEENRTEELYRMLLMAVCNQLSGSLPQMFEPIADYTELLFPDGVLKPESVLGMMTKLCAPEDDNWADIQVIGWLYQYYNTELKQETFDLLKKNIKITKERIGAATQLFTPKWIVRYMVENSLGRLWLDGHPDHSLQMRWRYYLEEAEQEPEVEAQLAGQHRQAAQLRPEDITALDPCMGSAHVLAYALDVLMDIYRSVGYTDRDAVESILTHNLYGLDIDDRAAQLAYFTLMMKACEYDRRFLRRGIRPHVCAIQESPNIDVENLSVFGSLQPQALKLLETFIDAKEYGSILTVPLTLEELEQLSIACDRLLREAEENSRLDVAAMQRSSALAIQMLIPQAGILARKYDAVMTNPPYMGKKSLNSTLSQYIDEHFPNGKSELYSAFIAKCISMTCVNGFTAMVTIHTWMFISSFEALRKDILQNNTIVNMMHTGAGTFEDLNSFNVLATCFVLKNRNEHNYRSTFVRLAEYYNAKDKLLNFDNPACRIQMKQSEFFVIPGNPFVYWISENAKINFVRFKQLRQFAEPKQGLATGDNDRFVRMWQEIGYSQIGFLYSTTESAHTSKKKWFPYNKGGNYRKWYGENKDVIKFNSTSYNELLSKGNHLPSRQFYFKEGITWSLFGFENFGVRYKDNGFVFDVSGSSMFPEDDNLFYILAFLAGKVSFSYLSILAPTVNFQVGNIGDLPLCIDDGKKKEIVRLAKECVSFSRTDWDSFETSWDFQRHPLI